MIIKRITNGFKSVALFIGGRYILNLTLVPYGFLLLDKSPNNLFNNLFKSLQLSSGLSYRNSPKRAKLL